GIAVERGETAIVDRLLSAGARTDGQMPDGEKILPWAIRQGRLAFVRAMMKSGADPHLKDRLGNPLLHVAMEAGKRDLMEALIEHGADPGATNAAGETTIQVAFRRGWLDVVPKLAAAGADPNARGVDGLSLLERAVEYGNMEHAVLLMKIGADPAYRHPSGDFPSPLERTFAEGHLGFFRLFVEHGTKPPGGSWDPWLWKACEARNHEAARLLLTQGAKAWTRGRQGLYPVEIAALADDATLVKMLADYGNPTGNALYHACARGNEEMAGLLMSCGAPVDVTLVPSLDTPLGAAIRGKHDGIATLLIEHGANVRVRLPEGQSALHLAVATGCHLTVKHLLDAGADANAPFETPVSPEFLKRMRLGFARWSLKYDKNVTLLMVASDSGNVNCARALIRAGAKMNVRTKATNTWPINFASRQHDVRMMRLFLGKDPAKEERRIEISISEQRARLLDSEGKELFVTKVSTGRKGFSTPTGEYVITNKYKDWTSTLYDASMPYFQRLSCGDFGLHQGNVPGYPASHGCIRVPAGNAQKLFTLTQAGDRVRILP
ncbi:MAG: hypothetical protein EOP87_12250, partial [Verrucomicrobiaceae bacterium]